MSFRALIPRFADLLDERLQLGGVGAEEDLRFTFLHTLVSAGECKHWEVRSEASLPKHAGKKLDVLVSGGPGHRLAAEFKYHREVFSVLPKPQLAGGIFSDLFRLGVVHSSLKCHCYFVYLTDSVMNSYLTNPKYGCSTVFSLPVCSRAPLGIDALHRKPATFLRAVNGFTNSIEVEAIFRATLSGGLHLHVYSVEHVPEAADIWD